MPRTLALGYARKSLVVAGTDPASPELQRAAIERAAADNRWALELYQDTLGHNSGRSDQRPGWKALTARLHDPAVAAVVVYSFDRLFRNVRHMLAFADEATQAGVKVVSVKDPIDFSTAQGRMILTMMSGFGEWYSNDVAEKRKASIDQLRRGRGRHYGDAPFGTERLPVNGDRVLFPSTKAQPNGTDFDALAALYELHAAGRLGVTGIACALNDAGWQVRGRGGALRQFWREDVRRILDQHWLYAGYVTVGRAYRNQSEILAGSHAAILPERLTAAAAATQSAKRHQAKRSAPLDYSLSGLLVCATCGLMLQGGAVRGRSYYRHRMRCAGGDKYHSRVCTIDAEVKAHVAALQLPADVVTDGMTRARGLLAPGRSQSAEAERTRQSLERLAELYLAGDVDRAFYDRRKAELTEASQPDATPDAGLLAVLNSTEWGTAALAMSPASLRNVARALYTRILVSEHKVVRYEPQEWCSAWA